MSPNLQIFNSRKEVLTHLTATGHSQTDIQKVDRGRGHRSRKSLNTKEDGSGGNNSLGPSTMMDENYEEALAVPQYINDQESLLDNESNIHFQTNLEGNEDIIENDTVKEKEIEIIRDNNWRKEIIDVENDFEEIMEFEKIICIMKFISFTFQ